MSAADLALDAAVPSVSAEQAELAEVQQALQPTSIPESRHIEISCWGRSTDGVGGDLHHVRRIDDHRIAFCVLDVTGHGAVAAIVAAYMKRSLLAAEAAIPDGDPDRILQWLNADLIDSGLASCRPVAAVYAVFDEGVGTVTLARAGTPHPALVEMGRAPCAVVGDGPLLGLLPDSRFELVKIGLNERDTLLLFTDGLEVLVASDSSSHGLGEAHRSLWAANWKRFDSTHCLRSLDRRWDDVVRADRDDATVIAIQARCRGMSVDLSGLPKDAEAALAV